MPTTGLWVKGPAVNAIVPAGILAKFLIYYRMLLEDPSVLSKAGYALKYDGVENLSCENLELAARLEA